MFAHRGRAVAGTCGWCMLAIDAWLLCRVFQPVVNRLARRISHFRLARECLTVGIVCKMAETGLLVWRAPAEPFAWVGAAGASLLIGSWVYLCATFELHDRREAAGHVRQPRWEDAFLRLVQVALTAFSLAANLSLVVSGTVLLAAYLFGSVGWLVAAVALYFAGCLPGTPSPKRERRWTILRWSEA